MPDYQITTDNAAETLAAILDGLESGKVYDMSVSERNIGKWTMTKLWRAWMSDVCKWMVANGARMPLVVTSTGEQYGSRPFSPEDCHELFVMQLLGCDEQGRRLSWSKSGRDGVRPASKGERLLAMQRMEAWASERGIKLMNPRDSEYRKLADDSEK